jgi:sortase A
MKVMLLAFLLAAAGAGLLSRDGYRRVKGAMATRLVSAAVDSYLADGTAHTPWAWADFQPTGRLYVPRLEISRSVLEGGEGQTMAFGLSHVPHTAAPGDAGLIGLAGHRDSWGGFIGDLRLHDLLVLNTANGDQGYRVCEILVVPRDDSTVLTPELGPGLTLVTCHPVDGILPTEMRLIVRAEEV